MFENAKIRRNLTELKSRVEKLEDEVLFHPIKTIRDAAYFLHLLRMAEGYHKLVLDGNPLDRANIKREIASFLREVKREAKQTKVMAMKPHFEMLIVGIGALLELA